MTQNNHKVKEVCYKVEFNPQLVNAKSRSDVVKAIRRWPNSIPFTIYQDNKPVLTVRKHSCSDCMMFHDGILKGECHCFCHELTSVGDCKR